MKKIENIEKNDMFSEIKIKLERLYIYIAISISFAVKQKSFEKWIILLKSTQDETKAMNARR